MKKTKIQWAESTVNFWVGCRKVSTGCKSCYFYRDYERYGHDPLKIRRLSDKTFYQALRWTKPRLIFTCSWSDFFIEEADPWRDDAWQVVRDTPHHTWQILTKRPERIMNNLPDDWEEGYHHVWLGVSAENQETYNQRWTIMQNIPAKLKFLSAEPLLGPIDIQHDANCIPDWVILGGESGYTSGKYKYRQCKTEWLEDCIAQCKQAKIPVFVKQVGSHLAKELGMSDWKGGEFDKFPDSLKYREIPNYGYQQSLEGFEDFV